MPRPSTLNRHALVRLVLFTLLASLPTAPTTATSPAQSNTRIPVLATNTGLSLTEGATTVITAAQLQLTDQDTPPSELRYRLTQLPAHGALLLQDRALPQGASFAQVDIDAGELRYRHDGGEGTSDSFAFTAADGPRPRVERVSVSSAGVQAGGDSANPSLSADGRFVAFESLSPNLVPNDTNTRTDIFVHDRASGQTSRVSVSSAATQGNLNSSDASLSANGRLVAFDSLASNLVPGDTNGASDAFVHDRETGQTTRVSISSNGTQGDTGSFVPTLSADGRVVAFFSSATTLDPNDANGTETVDVFVHDRTNGQTKLASISSAGVQGNADSNYPSLSGNGQVVAFQSDATTLVSGDTNGERDIFVHERASGQTSRVSISSNGIQGNGIVFDPSLSADGQMVAYASYASNLIPGDTTSKTDIFVHDRVSGQTSRASVSSNGGQGTDDAYSPSLSANGNVVAFESNSSELVSNDTNNSSDIFIHNLTSGQTNRVSVSSSGDQGDSNSYSPTLAANGRVVAFQSSATNLVPGDTNGKVDIFVYDQGIAAEVAVSIIAVNDPPTVSELADQTLIRDGEPATIPFTIGDAEANPDAPGNADALQVSVGSSNPALVPNGGLQLGGLGSRRVLAVVPAPGRTGSATITLQVGDGQALTTREFTVTVVEPPPEPPPAWLSLLYFAGDDVAPTQPGASSLSAHLPRALARLDSMPYNPDVRIVALFDGNQPGDSRLLIRQPSGWVTPTTLPPWFSDELDTGSVATLRNFLSWGRQQYPGAGHTFVAVVDHGGGWAPDEGSIGQPRGSQMAAAGGWTGLSLDASANGGVGSSLSTRDTGEAFAGMDPVDVLFFDACLMGMLESAFEVQPFARYFVAGQSILWSQLPYQRYLSPQLLNASTSPEAFARGLVEAYNADGPADEPYALAAWDLQQLAGEGGLVRRVEVLAGALVAASRSDTAGTEVAVRTAYAAAQKFDYDASYTQDPTDGYVDLSHFADQLAKNSQLGAEVREAASAVISQVAATILVSKTVEGIPRNGSLPWTFAGARGVSIYAPLGERDCRPTGRPITSGADLAVAPCAAPAGTDEGDFQFEAQLPYYLDKAQLRLAREAPSWVELLRLLDASTPNRDPKRAGPETPFQGDAGYRIFLPLARR